MRRFNVSVDGPVGESVTVFVEGEVDVSCAGEVTAAVESAAAPGVRSCIVDLTGVEFIDSSGIAALIRARGVLSTHSVELRTRTNEPVHRVFDIAGVVEHFAAVLDTGAGRSEGIDSHLGRVEPRDLADELIERARARAHARPRHGPLSGGSCDGSGAASSW